MPSLVSLHFGGLNAVFNYADFLKSRVGCAGPSSYQLDSVLFFGGFGNLFLQAHTHGFYKPIMINPLRNLTVSGW